MKPQDKQAIEKSRSIANDPVAQRDAIARARKLGVFDAEAPYSSQPNRQSHCSRISAYPSLTRFVYSQLNLWFWFFQVLWRHSAFGELWARELKGYIALGESNFSKISTDIR